MNEVRHGKEKLYKGSYLIVFYDKSDERLMYMFDTIRDILKFMKKPLTSHNRILVNTIIARALKTKNHFTRFLTGETLRVYLINTSDDEKGEQINED